MRSHHACESIYRHHVQRVVMLSLVLTALLGEATASAFNSSSNYTVWDANDACNQPIQSSNCMIDVDCSGCLTRPGCAIESTTGKCVSIGRIDATVGVEYFPSGSVEYCFASDNACTACGIDGTSADNVCRGTDGCVCIHQCEITPIQVNECSHSSFNLFYVLIAGCFVLPLMVFVRVHKFLATNLPTNISRRMLREIRQAQRDANPLTMKLDGWRSHMEQEQKSEPTKIELKRCSRLMSDHDVTSDLEEGRKTEDCDTLSISESGRHHSITSSHECDSDVNAEVECGYLCSSTPRAAHDADRA